jgi:hypothetical protein
MSAVLASPGRHGETRLVRLLLRWAECRMMRRVGRGFADEQSVRAAIAVSDARRACEHLDDLHRASCISR